MLILLEGERFRTTTDEWWTIANWNGKYVRTFANHDELNKYVAKHGIMMYRVATVKSVDLPPPDPAKIRTRKSMEVEFDASNGQHYIYVAVLHVYDTSADQPLTSSLDVQAFANLGGAQAFYKHMGTGDWYIENLNKVDQCWSLELASGNPHGAFKVTLHEVLLVKK